MRVAESTKPAVRSDAERVHPPCKPIRPPWRIFRAYFVTLVVLSSYLWLRFRFRYASRAKLDERLERLHVRNARRIYRAIATLQGLYIKVGQLFSIMSNFLPEAFRHELHSLQDQVPPRSYREIEQRIRDEFGGRGPVDLFEEFDDQPIASASIGQVHTARLPGGQKVAVKVQYPGIERIVRADLIALRRIFRLIERFIPYHGLDNIYNEIRAIVLQELDFTAEATSAQEIAKRFEGRRDVRFPRVIRELTTRRVLTTEFIEGVKVNDLRGLRNIEVDRCELAQMVIESYCQQIFSHGIYHADPHPGNILVAPGPTIHFIDFGAVAELSEKMRHGLLQLLQGALQRDTQKIISALQKMGFIAHRADPQVYDRVVEYFYERLQRELKLDSLNLKDIKFDPQRGLENLADLRQMDISLADLTDTFHVPKEWIMLERTILLIMGLCTELDPEINPMEVLRPHVEQFVLGEDGDWSRLMLDSSRDLAMSVVALPGEIKKFTSRALQGDLEIRLVGQRDDAPLYYALGQQLVYTAIGLTSAIAAMHFYDRSMEQLYTACIVVGGVSGLLLLRAMWAGRRMLRRRRRRRR